jgi:hypothetical protein
MNGFGGLHALSADGKELWHAPLANVWSQAVIPASGGMSAMVFATEASGSVRLFDGAGKPLRTLRPNGEYSTQVAAAVMDRSNKVQGLAWSQGHANAFDTDGRAAWLTSILNGPNGSNPMHPPAFACGDVAGRGAMQWALLDSAGDLVVATPEGQKLAALTGQSGVSGFVIVPDGKGRGLLVTLTSSTLHSYSFR